MPADHPGKLAGALRRRLGDGSLAAAMAITLAFVALTMAWQVESPGIHAQRDSLIWFGRAADVDQQMHTQGVLQAISIAARMHGSSIGFLAVSAVWSHLFGHSPHSLATLQATVIGLTGFIGFLAVRLYLGCGWSALAGLLVFFSSLETMAQARDLLPASHAALGMALLLLGLGQVSKGRARGTVLMVIGSCFAFLCRPELGAALLLALLAVSVQAGLHLARLGRVRGPGAKAKAARAQTRLLWGVGITVGAILAVAAGNHAALNDRLNQAGLLGNLSLELWRQRSQVLSGHAEWWTWYLLAPTGLALFLLGTPFALLRRRSPLIAFCLLGMCCASALYPYFYFTRMLFPLLLLAFPLVSAGAAATRRALPLLLIMLLLLASVRNAGWLLPPRLVPRLYRVGLMLEFPDASAASPAGTDLASAKDLLFALAPAPHDHRHALAQGILRACGEGPDRGRVYSPPPPDRGKPYWDFTQQGLRLFARYTGADRRLEFVSSSDLRRGDIVVGFHGKPGICTQERRCAPGASFQVESLVAGKQTVQLYRVE